MASHPSSKFQVSGSKVIRFAKKEAEVPASERVKGALVSGTAGAYLGGLLLGGKGRVKLPGVIRKTFKIRRKTMDYHGARTGAAIGALAGALKKKRSKSAEEIADRGTGLVAATTSFSAYIEDMTFSGLPKEVQKDVQRFVDAEKDTPVVHYGMTVKELLGKADPENLKTARKALGTLRASKAADEVISRTKDGSKYILLINDRIVDGHHFLAKAERGGVTSSLNVLDLTPARLTTRFSAAEMGLFLLEEMKKAGKWSDEKKGAMIGGATVGAATAGGAMGGSAGMMPKDDLRKTSKLYRVATGRGSALNERRVAVKKMAGFLGRAWRKDARLIAGAGAVGAGVGAAYGAGAVHLVKKHRQKKAAAAAQQFEEGRKNRTRDLRDKIGLAKDVAGLGLIGGVGYGAHRLYKKGSAAVAQAGPKIDAAMQQVKDTATAWKQTADSTNKNVQRVGRLAGDVKRRLDAPKRKVMIESRMKLRNEKRKAAGKAPSNLSKAMQGKGVKAPKMAVGLIQRLMLNDPRGMRFFEADKSVRAPVKRSKLQNVRDAALTGAGVAVTGAGVAAAMKAREAGKVADNIRNTTAIGADVGKVYRKARKVVTDSVDAFKGGMREAAGKAAPSWAKRTVKIGKKLRLLEAGAGRMEYGAMNEFILGALGTIAGTLAGSAAGAKFRYPVQNALKKKLVPKLGKTWGKRVARAGSFAPENAGALAGGAAGSFLTGGMRKRKEEDGSQFSVRGSRLNQLAWQALHQFGGNEQLADLDNGRFPDPFKKWLKGEKAYRKIDVTDYHRLRRRLLGRDLKPEQVNKIKSAMADIKDNKAVDIAGGQVLHSALRKADTVRKVTERGSGLVRDAVKAAKGEGREKDRWGREKKREWEKPWFQRRRNQLIATGGLLAAGYLGRHTKVGARAVRKGEEMIAKGRNWANKKLTNVFPDEGTEAARAAHNAKVTGKPQSTPADILKETEEMAKATRKEASQLNKAKKKAEAGGPELKLVPAEKPAPAPAAKPAAAAPKPASKPADKSVRAPVSKPAAASPAPAPKSAAAPVSKSPPPPVAAASGGGSPWSQSKIPTVSTNEKRHQAAAVKAASKPAAPKLKPAPVVDIMWGKADKPKPQPKPKPKPNKKTGFNQILIQALTQFADPLDVGWDIRDARGNSARVFAPHAGQRDRRPKRWHERVENERKLWAGAALTSTLAGGAAMRKLLGKQTKQTVDREVKRRVAQIGAAVKKRYTVKRAAGSGGGRAPNVVPFTPKEAA